MRSLLLLMAFLCGPAVASNFRVAEFGTPCDSISDREIAVGSRPVPWKDPPDPAFVAFRTELVGEEVTVVYLCPKGLLFTENYYFPEKEVEDSLGDFRKIYDSLTARYGQAFLDNTPWMSNADPRWIEKDPKRYYVTWKSAEVRVTIVLMPQEPSEASKRHVFVIVGANDK